MNEKATLLTFEEKLRHRKSMECVKVPINLKINRLLFVAESGTILSHMVSDMLPGPPFRFETFVSAVLSSLELCDSASARSLRLTTLELCGRQVIVIRYKCLILIGLHQANGPSVEFVKLMMLLLFGQYATRFPISFIEHFVALDNEYKNSGATKKNIDRESALIQLGLFQELNLDEVLQEMYSRLEPLYYSKDLQSLTKLKLQEVLISTLKEKQVLFHYSFCYNKYANVNFPEVSTFTSILHMEGEKLYQILKGKVTDSSQAFIIPENEVNLIFAPRLINLVQIPLWHFGDERLNINCIFKIRRNYQKLLRRSDLSSILSSQNYVRLFRNDENLKTFPFKEIDGDIQQYGQNIYFYMNTPVQQIKDWLDKYEAKVIFNMQKLQLEAAKEEEKEKRRVAELKSAAPLVHDRRGTLPGGEEESQQISRLKKLRHTRSQEGIKPLFTNEVSSSEDVVKNIPRISQRRILPLESARSIPKTDLQQTPAFRTEDQRGGSKNVGPVGKILETIKSTLGDQQVEDGGENSLGEIKVEIIPEEVGKRIGTIMEEEIKGEAEEKQVLDMQKIDLSSIQVKKEDLGISALTFGDESVFNGDKDAQRNNQKPEGFLEDVSPISFKSKDKDKSSFAYPF